MPLLLVLADTTATAPDNGATGNLVLQHIFPDEVQNAPYIHLVLILSFQAETGAILTTA